MVSVQVLKTKLRNSLSVLTLLAGALLLVSVSWEIIAGDETQSSHRYMTIQLIVCLLFLLDFFVRWSASSHRGRFFLNNSFFFLVSIPYLNIIAWYGIRLPHDVMMLVGVVPMIRTFLASYMVVRWLVATRIRQIFFTYIFTAVTFTYLAALVFYAYESKVNEHLQGFGNALWWAWMNFTTVGASIFAVTPVGKVLSVLLPTLGMLMFPIVTAYLMQRYPYRGADKK